MAHTHDFSISDKDAQQHSDQLSTIIQQEIELAGGHIAFSRYMQLCLYHPELGYYSSGKEKIGRSGDFTTAPEISPLFGQALSRHVVDAMTQITQPPILEIGAGNGSMAATLLLTLDQQHCLPEHYYIIEVSAYLVKKQKQLMSEQVPELIDRVTWLTALPERFDGVIIANEVCDAMPIERVEIDQDTAKLWHVTHGKNGFEAITKPIEDADLLNRIEQVSTQLTARDGYLTEINLQADAWLASLADRLDHGAIFIIDYGYVRSEYYHPDRVRGTLMCYYQHQGHDDPFVLPGLQDITSHVDFTALAEIAHQHRLDVAGFQSQADFLLAGDITEVLSQQMAKLDTFEQMQLTAAVKQLTLPSAMGESFKVLTLTKNLAELLPRCQLADRRYQL